MSILHHPNDETILAHAAGTLDPALALVVTRHLAMCPACRDSASWGGALGGALLERAAPSAPSKDDAKRALAMVRAHIAG
ncbi:MAG: zf-HC2 domain-containing protein, partial [Sedimenticolaceae bacterium]